MNNMLVRRFFVEACNKIIDGLDSMYNIQEIKIKANRIISDMETLSKIAEELSNRGVMSFEQKVMVDAIITKYIDGGKIEDL